MKYKKMERSLLEPTLSVVTELGLFNQVSKNQDIFKLYTFYRDIDSKISLGFTNELQISCEYYSNLGYRLIGERTGSENEFKILTETLSELGYTNINKYGEYFYSISLIKHLDILGWPTGKINRKKKINKYLYPI